MKRHFLILFLLFAFLAPLGLEAQSGGRKRERTSVRKKKKKFTLRRTVSAGHADEFARSRGRKNIFARLFRRDRPAWVYRPTGTAKSNWKDNKFLFSRHRSPGKIENERFLQKQNARRDRHRSRGNDSMGKRRKR